MQADWLILPDAVGALLAVPAFTVAGVATTRLELVAVGLAVAMVLLNMRVNPWAWPLAIGSSLLYLELFWHHRLYGDGALQVFFAAVAAWGWWQWVRGTGDDGRPLVVRHLTARGRWAVVAAVAIAWPMVALYLDRATDTDVPWWDAFPTAASVVGQWLLARKRVENWPLWVVVNTVAAGLFAYKGLWLTAMLYAVFVVMALGGWHAWRRLAAQAAQALQGVPVPGAGTPR